MNKPLTLVSLLLLLGGCATTPQTVYLYPDVAVTGSDVGKGKTVALTVTDARANKVLGYRTTRLDKDSVIVTDSDIAKVAQERIYEGLKKYGFNVNVGSGDAPVLLKVEVQALEYSAPTGSWTGGIRTSAKLKAYVKNGLTTYENSYEVTNNETVVIPPSQGKNEELINKTLADVLQNLLKDQKLIALLAKQS
ncbi:MAG TPA: YajG family lipoprotein [Burkholderiales bacterium]|nr:YajG family lipoprotein [Burkholderiales bacterium]